jgi:hypothetical protein
MAWQHYHLCFRLLSPLHVGYRKVGNLMQTRPYVPGKNLWAALTARLTRDFDDGADGQRYLDIGETVKKSFRFGYLWPSLDGKSPYFPWEHDDFDYLLLDSYAGTALDYDRAAALEGSLRETEFIAPVARDERPVFLSGDLWMQEDSLPADLAGWKQAMQHVQLGGERGYGWGRMTLVTDLAQPGEPAEPIFLLQAGQPITAHVLAVGTNRAKAVPHVEGPVEPLVGWERDNITSGRTWRLSDAVIAYAPGATARQELRVRVGPFGIWEAAA